VAARFAWSTVATETEAVYERVARPSIDLRRHVGAVHTPHEEAR
jgi:hypothetical protein